MRDHSLVASKDPRWVRGFVTEQHYDANVECEMEYVCVCKEGGQLHCICMCCVCVLGCMILCVHVRNNNRECLNIGGTEVKNILKGGSKTVCMSECQNEHVWDV